MSYQNKFVKVEVDRGLAVVTLDRPSANAVSLEVYDELRRTFHRLGEDNVTTVEVDPDVAERADTALEAVGFSTWTVTGDGLLGHLRDFFACANLPE